MPPSRLRRPLLAVALVLGTAGSSAAQLAASAWPMYQRDLQHTGRSPHVGPLTTPTICWEYRGGRRRAAPTLGADGSIYLTVSRRPLVAIDPDTGFELWPNNPGLRAAADRSQGAVDVNGFVYIGTRGNKLFQFAPDGSIPWFISVGVDGDVSTPPAIGPDGTIYMASDALGAGRLYAINPDGSQKWMQVLGAGIKNVSPALSHDASTLYVTTQGRTLWARVAATGAPIWSVHVQNTSVGTRAANFSPIVGADGTIYFATRSGVYARNPDGSEKWTFSVGAGAFNSPPAVGADGKLFIGHWQPGLSRVFALDGATGGVVWQEVMQTADRFRNNAPIVGGDGTVYVGHSRYLYAFDPDGDGGGGGQLVWGPMPVMGRFEAGPVIAGPGVLYAGAGSRLWKLSDQGCD